MRSSYWSNSKFANWVRGTIKPNVETSKGWKEWEETAQKNHPIRYWIVEEGFDYVQNIVNWPYDKFHSIRYYINNRWIDKSHCLVAHPRDIKPGTWCDVGERFLFCMFNELVDFVEIETAWHHVIWDDEARKKYSPPWWRKHLFRVRMWRCPEAGMNHLVWASNLVADDGKTPTYQAEAAKEIINLYIWWTATRPARPDPYEVSGWSEICKSRKLKKGSLWDNETPEEAAKSSEALKKINELEEQYNQEDEEMLIRLIRIRKSLWT